MYHHNIYKNILNAISLFIFLFFINISINIKSKIYYINIKVMKEQNININYSKSKKDISDIGAAGLCFVFSNICGLYTDQLKIPVNVIYYYLLVKNLPPTWFPKNNIYQYIINYNPQNNDTKYLLNRLYFAILFKNILKNAIFMYTTKNLLDI